MTNTVMGMNQLGYHGRKAFIQDYHTMLMDFSDEEVLDIVRNRRTMGQILNERETVPTTRIIPTDEEIDQWMKNFRESTNEIVNSMKLFAQ